MDLLTFSTFLFIAVEGFFFGTKCLTVPRKIPLRFGLPTNITVGHVSKALLSGNTGS